MRVSPEGDGEPQQRPASCGCPLACACRRSLWRKHRLATRDSLHGVGGRVGGELGVPNGGGRASWRVWIRIRCTEHPGLDSLPPTVNSIQHPLSTNAQKDSPARRAKAHDACSVRFRDQTSPPISPRRAAVAGARTCGHRRRTHDTHPRRVATEPAPPESPHRGVGGSPFRMKGSGTAAREN